MRHARSLLAATTLALYGCADSESPGGGGGGPTPQPTPAPTAPPPPNPRTWVSGDTHIHATGCAGSSSTSNLISRMQRGDVNVGAALVWGGRYDNDLPKFTGGDHRDSVDNHILHFDLEVSAFAAEAVGHLILLGLREINYSSDPFRSPATGVPIVSWARAQDPRVTVGYAHTWDWPANGSFPLPSRAHIPQVCCTPFELPVEVARDRVHFMETDHIDDREGHTIPAGMAYIWSQLQNAGFRIGLTGGTDLFCFGFGIGDLQTHAAIEGGLTYPNFLAALRAGRTAVVVGPDAAIDVTVSEASSGRSAWIGDELRVGAGSELVVDIDITQPRAGTVTIMVNGDAQQTLNVGAGQSGTTARLTLSRSSWIAVRSSYVQTSAIYVLVDGAPIRSADAACYLKRYMDHFIDLANSGAFKRGSLQGGMGAYMQARDIYMNRFQDAGGTSCN